MATTSNIDDFKKAFKNFYNSILRVENVSDKVSQAMQQNVLKIARGHRQSGDLMRELASEDEFGFQNSKSNGEMNYKKVLFGFGNLEGNLLNSVKRRQQWATFQTTLTGRGKQGAYADERVFHLRAEPDLPEWIILEFGRRSGTGVSSADIPKDFRVNYSARDDSKEFMFGPSTSRHFAKPVFFMFNGEETEQHDYYQHNSFGRRGRLRRHPGSEAIHMFQRGLEASKPEINTILGHAIKDNLVKFAQKNGGKVE